jgi:hypothetical protein
MLHKYKILLKPPFFLLRWQEAAFLVQPEKH